MLKETSCAMTTSISEVEPALIELFFHLLRGDSILSWAISVEDSIFLPTFKQINQAFLKWKVVKAVTPCREVSFQVWSRMSMSGWFLGSTEVCDPSGHYELERCTVFNHANQVFTSRNKLSKRRKSTCNQQCMQNTIRDLASTSSTKGHQVKERHHKCNSSK